MPRIPPPPPPGGNKPPQQPRLQAPPPPNTPGHRSAPPPPPSRGTSSPDSKEGRGEGALTALKAYKHWVAHCFSVLTLFPLILDDLENRFQFSIDLPSPEMWKAGPKTYPSQNALNRTRSGGGGGAGMFLLHPLLLRLCNHSNYEWLSGTTVILKFPYYMLWCILLVFATTLPWVILYIFFFLFVLGRASCKPICSILYI